MISILFEAIAGWGVKAMPALIPERTHTLSETAYTEIV
jgi:hypothetical protein